MNFFCILHTKVYLFPQNNFFQIMILSIGTVDYSYRLQPIVLIIAQLRVWPLNRYSSSLEQIITYYLLRWKEVMDWGNSPSSILSMSGAVLLNIMTTHWSKTFS